MEIFFLNILFPTKQLFGKKINSYDKEYILFFILKCTYVTESKMSRLI